MVIQVTRRGKEYNVAPGFNIQIIFYRIGSVIAKHVILRHGCICRIVGHGQNLPRIGISTMTVEGIDSLGGAAYIVSVTCAFQGDRIEASILTKNSSGARVESINGIVPADFIFQVPGTGGTATATTRSAIAAAIKPTFVPFFLFMTFSFHKFKTFTPNQQLPCDPENRHDQRLHLPSSCPALSASFQSLGEFKISQSSS
jgi:hypothetical protein